MPQTDESHVHPAQTEPDPPPEVDNPSSTAEPVPGTTDDVTLLATEATAEPRTDEAANGHRTGAEPAPSESLTIAEPAAQPRLLARALARPWRLLALPAVALAAYAERLVAEARGLGLSVPPAGAWWLFGLAAVLFAVAAWPVPALLPALPAPFVPVWRDRRRRVRFFLPLGLAILCGAIAAPGFVIINRTTPGQPPPEPANTGAWLLWIAALLLFGAAWIVWERTTPAPARTERDWGGDRLPARLEWTLLAGLLALALALRLPNLDNVPPGLWFDEAQNGIVAQQLLAPGAAHPTFIADFTQMGALYFYFLGLVIKLFGATIWPLRLLPALMGAAVAPLLYLLGARLYGWRVGLAVGGLVAVSAWNLTFSRFGMDSMPTVALDVAVYLCAAQALRTGRLGYFAGAGVLLGLAMQMYYPARLVPFLLGLLLIHLLVFWRMRAVQSIRAGLVIFALGAVLAFLPVGLFAIQQPAVWGGRVSDVSVFNPDANGGDPQALQHSLDKHLLMFNYQGDANGRHDLPGAPLLDDITAALFILGLGTCILRAWRWQYFFPVAWFAAALSGGVLSLPFEAPQSHRTLENSVVTALLAGIVLGELWQLLLRPRAPEVEAPAGAQARRGLGGRLLARPARTGTVTTLPTRKRASATIETAPPPTIAPVPARVVAERGPWRVAGWVISIAGVLAVVAWAGSQTLPRYFVQQAEARGVWMDMYAPQATVGHILAQENGKADLFVSQIYLGLPPLKYLAPNANPQAWPGLQAIPFADTSRDVIVMLHPSDAADLGLIARIYPHATFDPLITPSDPGPMMYTVRIPASDIAGLHGVHATLYDPGAAQPRAEQTLPNMDFDWSTTGSKPGTVRLSTTLHVNDSANYSFRWQPAGNPGPDALQVDGFPVTATTTLLLGSGLHSIVATDTVASAAGIAQLQWGVTGGAMQPVPAVDLFDPRRIEPHGLTGIYRPGVTATAPPRLARVDPVISFYFQVTPLERPYNVDWSGRIYIPETGSYGFATEQISESYLEIDGKEVIRNLGENNTANANVALTAGWHTIHLFYIDRANYSHVYLYWTPPGQGQSIIPSAFLWPDMGTYPNAPETGAWPTLAEAQGNVVPPDRISSAPGNPPPANPPPANSVPTNPPPANTPPAPPPGNPPANPPPAADNPTPPPLGSAGPSTALQPVATLGAAGSLLLPRAAAADGAGNLYVFTEGDSKIAKFGPDGKLLTSWVVARADGQPVTEGSGLLVEGDHIRLLDAGGADLLDYDPSGKSLGHIHLCECFAPRAIAPAQGGGYWLADTGDNRVVKVAAAGGIIQTLGDKGTGPGEFVEPAGVWESPQGVLFVADIGNGRVQSLKPDGTPLAQWAVGASIARDGNRVTGDSAGNVLVTEVAAQAVVRFTPQGQETGRWTYAQANGAITPPQGIAPAGGDQFVVLYLNANTAVVFRPGK